MNANNAASAFVKKEILGDMKESILERSLMVANNAENALAGKEV